ncbi:MAG: zinc-binding dehydrogenase, partial [Rhizobiales bacterium]|nr:zinc-binding dehydrogenase [Hyphomicrobiales bacterium]
AGGSIGIFGVQIAKMMGAEVTAVDSGAKEGLLRAIGADHFIDYEKQDFTKNEQKYDVIFDMVAQSVYANCIKSLSAGGRYLMANPRISDMLKSIFTTRFSDKKVYFAFAGEKEAELLDLKEMIESGKIKSAIHKVYPMNQASEAHEAVETERRVGSVVMSLTDLKRAP